MSIGKIQIAQFHHLLDNSNMKKELRAITKARLEELERNPFEAARIGGLERSFINDVLIGKKTSVRGANLDKFARALDFSITQLIHRLSGSKKETISVQIVGKIGAGGNGSVQFAAGDGHLGEAPVPPGANESTVAVEVSGTSMRGIAEDGWLIYYDDRRSPVDQDLIGELCVLGLENGDVLVKTPFYGREEGLFDLESTNAPTLRNQKVEWGALVTAIIPRRTARKINRPAKP